MKQMFNTRSMFRDFVFPKESVIKLIKMQRCKDIRTSYLAVPGHVMAKIIFQLLFFPYCKAHLWFIFQQIGLAESFTLDAPPDTTLTLTLRDPNSHPPTAIYCI